MSIGNFGNFSQFCSTDFGYYLVTLPSDTNNGNWINGTCTCPCTKHNKDGSVAKKRGPKPKTDSL